MLTQTGAQPVDGHGYVLILVGVDSNDYPNTV